MKLGKVNDSATMACLGNVIQHVSNMSYSPWRTAISDILFLKTPQYNTWGTQDLETFNNVSNFTHLECGTTGNEQSSCFRAQCNTQITLKSLTSLNDTKIEGILGKLCVNIAYQSITTCLAFWKPQICTLYLQNDKTNDTIKIWTVSSS